MITLTINNEIVSVPWGTTVATAVLTGGAKVFRRSVTGKPRFPVCGMGICFECRVSINGNEHQPSCQRLVEEGMVVETDE